MKESEEPKNIYCLMSQHGRIANEDLHLIRKNLINRLAEDKLFRALEICRGELTRANIFVLQYGGVEIYAVRGWETTARTTRLNVKFLNQEVHDLDGWGKVNHMTN